MNRYALLVLVAGALTMAGAAGFARYAFPLLLPDMREALNATYGHMGMMVTVNNIGYVITASLGGFISARYGMRRVIFVSMALAGIMTVATGLAPAIEFALVMQFLVGLSAGGAVIPAMGLAGGSFEPRQRGLATGIVVAGFPLSMLLSSIFLPVVLSGLGAGSWRYGWIILGVLVITMGTINLIIIRDRPPGRAAESGPEVQQATPATRTNWGLLYKNRTIWLLCVINLTIGLSAGIFTTFFVAYLVDQRGLPTSVAASAWGLVGLMGIVSGMFWGYISDKAGRRLGLAACYYCYTTAIFVLTFVTIPGAEYASGLLGGMAFTGGMAICVALLSDTVGPGLASAGFGLISLFFNAGQVISPSLAGIIIDSTGTFVASLIASTLLCFLSATLCLFLRPPKLEDAL